MTVSSKLKRFGLLHEGASPPERVFVKDVHSDTSITPRQVPDRDTDPDGATYFSSFNSTFSLAAADIEGVGPASGWMADHVKVKALAVLEGAFVQWYELSRIVARDSLSPGEAALVTAEYAMRRDAGGTGPTSDNTAHGVYLTRNALLPTGATGTVNATLPWPVDSTRVTLSAEFANLDGTEELTLEAQDANGAALDSTTVTPSAAGRDSVTFTTPEGTFFLAVTVSGAQVTESALRLGTADTYVEK